MNNKFNQFGLQECNKFMVRGLFVFKMQCMPIFSIIWSPHQNLLKSMPWNYCVNIVINFTRAKLEFWNATIRTTTLDTFWFVELICPLPWGTKYALTRFSHHLQYYCWKHTTLLLHHVAYKCYNYNYNFDGKTLCTLHWTYFLSLPFVHHSCNNMNWTLLTS
jgi:hypothetical protein